jgi:hypothetical protein
MSAAAPTTGTKALHDAPTISITGSANVASLAASSYSARIATTRAHTTGSARINIPRCAKVLIGAAHLVEEGQTATVPTAQTTLRVPQEALDDNQQGPKRLPLANLRAASQDAEPAMTGLDRIHGSPPFHGGTGWNPPGPVARRARSTGATAWRTRSPRAADVVREHPVRSRGKVTAVYLVCFHSVKPKTFRGSAGQYLAVETAIREGEWPYDNGDDPSFYVARRGGPLTWGVCRQDLRNAIAKDSIVVFFSFTPAEDDRILYRLCAVATVNDRLDHRAVHGEDRFSQFRERYINGLIRPDNGGWRYWEADRPGSHRHEDWLWRIADHRGMSKEDFDRTYATICKDRWFSDSAVVNGELQFGSNYIVFCAQPNRTFISPDPPEVAIATKGKHEKWIDPRLQALTVGMATYWGERNYLRIVNPSGRNVHRQIAFKMPAARANSWRDTLIATLKERPVVGC